MSLVSLRVSPPKTSLDSASNPSDWHDWRWQLRHRIDDPTKLAAALPLTEEERRGVEAAPDHFRIGITPYYLSLIDPAHPQCPIRLQIVPRAAELVMADGERVDPLGEDERRPTTGIIHRYPDRVLLLALDRCAVYCRHCNRRRLVGSEEQPIRADDLRDALEYIRSNRRIRDVLISGGDPLCLSTDKLMSILQPLRAIDHVEVIRLGTRVPVVLPMRVDAELCQALRTVHPLFINTHFNHPKELTPEAVAACGRLADAGIPLGNQTVLLRGVNSSLRTLRALFRGLLRARVRPYYLFQGDVAVGTDHLRTPLAKAMELAEGLRGHLSGMAIPHVVVDLPGGHGKVPIGPSYLISQGTSHWVFRGYDGALVSYPEPADRDCHCAYEEVYFAGEPNDEAPGGVAQLLRRSMEGPP
jgi:lysine 2,3-aminomutase